MEQEQRQQMKKDAMIQELIKLLNQNQQKEIANNIYEMAALMDGMEKKLGLVMEELLDTRKQLGEMQEKQERKASRASLNAAVEKIDKLCQVMKAQLFELKSEVRTKAQEIISETVWKGKSALNRVSECLGIKKKLEHFRANVQQTLNEVDQTIGRIEAFGTRMREAFRKAGNAFRAIAWKQEKVYENKKFTKTEMLKKPFQIKRNMLAGILKYADAAIGKCEKLSLDCAEYQNEMKVQEFREREIRI